MSDREVGAASYPLLAREAELERLGAALDGALAGRGGVHLVSGEPGSGKTALLDEFARLASAAHPDLLLAVGTCDAQTGEGDAYLPFREVMQQLTGDVEAQVAQGRVSPDQARRLKGFMLIAAETLVELAPDLIGTVVPGATLLARAGKALSSKAKWAEKLRTKLEQQDGPVTLEKTQVYEQYANVLQRLSAAAPLLLVVDDLQWADTASLGLLFRLARRLEGMRVLLVGLYRPNDLAVSRDGRRHPLEGVLSEIKRYAGDVTIDLDAAVKASGPAFVDSLLEREPNALGRGFRNALLAHTGGHPLFTIELLRDLEERGDLVKDGAGRWVEGPALAWDDLPSRVEGVIEERLNRLDDDLLRCLRIASVEGPQFTAEAVAVVLPSEPRELIRQIGETLQRRHRLVSAVGLKRVGAQRLSLYAFVNQLMQSFLYHQLDEAEASYLHEDVGLALESLHGDQADQIAIQLAWHFSAAGVTDKARRYQALAAEQAEAAYANEQALAFYRAALENTPLNDLAERYRLLLKIVRLDEAVADRAARRADIEALTALAEELADPYRQAEAAVQLARHELEAGEHAAALLSAQRAAGLAGPLDDDPGLEARARLTWGRVLMAQSRHDEAKEQLTKGMVLARLAGDRQTEANAYTSLGISNDVTGHAAEGRRYFELAVAAHEARGDRLALGNAYMNLAVALWRAGELPEATELLRRSLATAREVGDRSGAGMALANLAILLRQPDVEAARGYAEEALQLNRELGSPYAVARTLGVYASVLVQQGDLLGARTAEEEALEIDLRVGDRQDEVFRRSSLGAIATALGDFDEAERQLRTGLEVGEAIDELWALCAIRGSLSVLFELQGRVGEAVGEAEAAYDLALRVESRSHQVLQLVRLARARMAAGEPDAAVESADKAAAFGPGEHVPDIDAVRAEAAMAAGDFAAARSRVEPLVTYVTDGALERALEPQRLCLTVVRALLAAGDARAEPALASSLAMWSELESRLADEPQRLRLRRHPIYAALLEARTGPST